MSDTGDLVTRIYGNFRGADFRGEEINLVRSPDCLNVWKDYKETESIRTRPAMEYVTGSKAHSFTLFKDSIIAHCGTQLFKLQNYPPYNATWLSQPDDLADNKSVMFIHDEKIYIMDGVHYYWTDGFLQVQEVEGYVPTTSIARKPAGGGTIHEDVNFLTGRRINTFLADTASTEYFLDTTNIDTDFAPIVKVDDKIVSGYKVDYAAGKITFTKAPDAPKTDGQDNVSVEFCKTLDGYRDTILKCTLVTIFDNRVFVSGNPDKPNFIWHCSLDNPAYFSDLDYYQEGLDTAKVKGMVAGNNALWVFREPSVENTTVFYHTPTIDAEYGKIYPSVHSSASIGCVGKAINFNDDIVFFSERGMEGISGDVTTEQVVAHRSSLVDRKLTAEEDYADMVLAEWEGYLLVFIGDKAYVADSRAVITVDNHIEYEWFYWEMEKKINCAITNNGVLYLGTDDGIYTLTDNTKDIESYWVTPKDKFKYPHMQKTTNKKSCTVEATGDEISVYAKTNKDDDFILLDTFTDVKDAFSCRVKKKKFKDLQLKFYSPKRFSLETATLECFIGGYLKNL